MGEALFWFSVGLAGVVISRMLLELARLDRRRLRNPIRSLQPKPGAPRPKRTAPSPRLAMRMEGSLDGQRIEESIFNLSRYFAPGSTVMTLNEEAYQALRRYYRQRMGTGQRMGPGPYRGLPALPDPMTLQGPRGEIVVQSYEKVLDDTTHLD